MKIRFSWLKDYVHLQESIEEIENTLTMLGFVPEERLPWGTDDYVLDLEITVNRPDMLSHLGVARELSAAFNRPLTPGFKKPEESDEHIENHFNRVIIESTDFCHRYVARIVRNVQIGPSPDWLRDRLESVGIRPINNVVDITNYVMYAYGQPLHAFDLDRLSGKEIRVRYAREGEKILLLDETERTLNSSIPVIADAEKPVAIAGIMGGMDSSVTHETRNILIESAWFDPRIIRRARKLLDLQTDASYRFERGADIGITAVAADYAAYLISVMAGGQVLKGTFDVFPVPFDPPKIHLHDHWIKKILGVRPDPEWIRHLFQKLGFDIQVLSSHEPSWLVQVPSFRRDILQETDLVEEIARHYGYDRIPETLPELRGERIPDYPEAEIEAILPEYFAGRGFMEHMSTSFASDSLLAIFDMGDPVPIQNPISDDDRYLRTCLAMGLTQAVSWNHRRQQLDVRLWELGNVFWLKESEPVEHRHIGLVISGQRQPPQLWKQASAYVDFYDIKGEILVLFRHLPYEEPDFLPSTHPFLHPYQQMDIIVADTKIGFIGRLHPKYEDPFELRCPVYLAEICLTRLLTLPRKKTTLKTVPDLPVIQRDLSIIVKNEIPFETITSVLNRLNIPELSSWMLIDIYRGQPIPDDAVSYTLRFFFSPLSPKRSEEIEAFMNRIFESLKESVGAQRR